MTLLFARRFPASGIRRRRTIAVLLAVAVGAVVSPAASAIGSTAPSRTWDFARAVDSSQWFSQRGAVTKITDGAGALRLTNSTGGTVTMSLNDIPNQTGAAAGQIYRLSADIRVSQSGMTVGTLVREASGTTLLLDQHAQEEYVAPDTAWHRVTVDYPVKTTGGSIDLNVMAWRAPVNSRIDIDNVSFSQVGGTAPTPVLTPTKCGAQGKLAPACGALWGVYTLRGSNPQTSVTDLEAKVGRQFDLTLRYHDFSDTFPGRFPDAYQAELGKTRVQILSWQARVSKTGAPLQWRDIANGVYDTAYVKTAAARVKAFGKPLIIAFDAEFDSHKTKGTMADYVAAYRHLHTVFAAAGVTNVVWAWVSTGYLGAGNDARILAGYPGDAYVDWVGYDPYNFYRCNNSGWKTFETTVSRGYNWLMSQGFGSKPFLISEYSTQFDPANQAASNDWNRSIPSVLKRYPNLKALVRFDSNGTFGSTPCNMYINNGAGMLQSYAQAGMDPYLRTRS